MQTRNGNSAPLVEVPDPEAEAKQKLARQALDEAAAKVRRHRETAGKGKAFAAWLAKQTAPAGVSPLAVAPAFYLPLDDSGPRLNYLATLDGKVGGHVAGKPTAAKRPGGAGIKLAGAVVEFADNAPFDANRPFTFAAWVKLPANGGGPLLTRMEEDPTYAGFDIGFESMRPGLHLVRWERRPFKWERVFLWPCPPWPGWFNTAPSPAPCSPFLVVEPCSICWSAPFTVIPSSAIACWWFSLCCSSPCCSGHSLSRPAARSATLPTATSTGSVHPKR